MLNDVTGNGIELAADPRYKSSSLLQLCHIHLRLRDGSIEESRWISFDAMSCKLTLTSLLPMTEDTI
jgi:hypothetical protein